MSANECTNEKPLSLVSMYIIAAKKNTAMQTIYKQICIVYRAIHLMHYSYATSFNLCTFTTQLKSRNMKKSLQFHFRSSNHRHFTIHYQTLTLRPQLWMKAFIIFFVRFDIISCSAWNLFDIIFELKLCGF